MAWLRRRRQANKERMKRREVYTRELQRFWRGYCGRRDIWNAKEYARSRRPVVLWCFHFIQTTRVHQTRSWLVSFSISRQFGPHRATAMLRAGERHRLPGRPLLVRCGPELRPVQAAGPAHDPLGRAALVYGRVAAMASGRCRKLTTLRRGAVDATRSTQGGC